MFSFELKTVIAAKPSRVWAVITDPKLVLEWDYCVFVQNDGRVGGKLRKRDEEGRLFEGEIVAFDTPYRFGIIWPLLLNPDEDEENDERFLTHVEYLIEGFDSKTVLTRRAEGFPTEELAGREKNSWGGYFLEKLKKVAEKGA
jgi:uncharacterized protein YndB with AHSA1/START domain